MGRLWADYGQRGLVIFGNGQADSGQADSGQADRNSFRVQLSARGIAICFASAQPKAQPKGR